VLDTVKETYENVRVDYDIELAAATVLQARLPDYLAHRLFLGI
jgi:hypothetical protein